MRLAVLLTLLATTANATPFDGLYRPDATWAEGWDCVSVGSDGGALSIENNTFNGVENTCTLSNPTPVRGMDAILYDAECSGEGMTNKERMMIMRTYSGIAIVRDLSVAPMVSCQAQ